MTAAGARLWGTRQNRPKLGRFLRTSSVRSPQGIYQRELDETPKRRKAPDGNRRLFRIASVAFPAANLTGLRLGGALTPVKARQAELWLQTSDFARVRLGSSLQ